MDRTADAHTAQIEIHTHREGMLSRVGHDLVLDASRFEIQLRGTELTARIEAAEIRVRAALREGRIDPAALSPRDRAQIDAALHDEVLDASAHPVVSLRVTVPAGFTAGALRGELTLRGATRPVSLGVSREGSALIVRATVQQEDFGIRPFTALLGALRVRGDVEVVATLPWG